MKNINFLKHNLLQRITYDKVLTRYGELDHENLKALVTSLVGKKNCVIYGCNFETLSNLTFRIVEDSVLLQRLNPNKSEIISEQGFKELTVETADATYTRFDIVEGKLEVVARNKVSYDKISDLDGSISTEINPTSNKVILTVRVRSGIPSINPTAPVLTPALPAIFIADGTYLDESEDIDLYDPVDLSAEYLIQLSVNDEAFEEINVQGATPNVTTIEEIVAAINGSTQGLALDKTGTTKTFSGNNPVNIAWSSHGLKTGHSVYITNSSDTAALADDVYYEITVVDEDNFTVSFDGTGTGGTCDIYFGIAAIVDVPSSPHILRYLKLQSPTNNEDSRIRLISPSSADCIENIFGLREDDGDYFYKFESIQEWIKLGEVQVLATQTVLTSESLRDVYNKDKWTILNPDTDPFVLPNLIALAEDHYKTNFSLNQKEGYDDVTQYDNQYAFQNIPLGSKFNIVKQEKTFLHNVDMIEVPAISDELTWAAGGWSDDASASYSYGIAKTSITNDDFVTFDFDGVEVGIIITTGTSNAGFKAELSEDGGSTWTNRKVLHTEESSTTRYGKRFMLYTGLEYKSYKVKITLVTDGVKDIFIEGFYYVTYMIQKSTIQNYPNNPGFDFNFADVSTVTSEIDNGAPHGFLDNEKIIFIDGGNGLPSPLVAGTAYYVIVSTANKIKVTDTPGGSNITLLSQGGNGNSVKENETLDDVPVSSFVFNGNWVLISTKANAHWNSVYSEADDTCDGAYCEFRFYGSKVWICLQWDDDTDIDVSLYIDNAQTKLKYNTFNTDTGATAVDKSTFIRIDNGTLEEGWHDVRLEIPDPVTAGQRAAICGYGYYSSSATSTVCRAAICGKDSYAMGVTEIGASSFHSTWTSKAAGNNKSFLREYAYTSTSNSYMEITTPNNPNLKAIYLIYKISAGSCADTRLTLGGSFTNYKHFSQRANFELRNMIALLYDKAHDGNLHNKALRILNGDSTELSIEGIIYEIGNPVENEYLFIMPKFVRVNNTAYSLCPPTVSYRLDVYGDIRESNPGCDAFVHSGWLPNVGGGSHFFRHGLGLIKCTANVYQETATPGGGGEMGTEIYSKENGAVTYENWLILVNSIGCLYSNSTGYLWKKIILKPDRVI